MKRKYICMIVLALVFACSFIACEAQTQPSQEELESMYINARQYRAKAEYTRAIELYRELDKYGYDFYGDTTIEDLERDYLHQITVSAYYSLAASSLKNQLRDPNSLVIYDMDVDKNSPAEKITVIITYGAKNGFGGMGRDTYTKTYLLNADTRKEIYEANKSEMDSLGLSQEYVGQYLAKHTCIYLQSEYNAIALID